MNRLVRLWIAAVLIAVLALPAVPAMARHGQGDNCCAGMVAPAGAADECDVGVVTRDPVPTCIDGGSNQDPTQPASLCVHCMVAAASAGVADGSPAASLPLATPAYVVPSHVSSFVPAAPVDRLERPPKSLSF